MVTTKGVGLDGVPGTNDAYNTGLWMCHTVSCAGRFVICITFQTYYVPPWIRLVSLIGQ